jgi:F-type H+-transporting ATPase subunit delta
MRMSNKKVARRYTLALFELTEELKLTDKIVKDFSDLISSIEKSKELKLFLKTPIINSPKKGKVLDVMLKGKFSDLTIKFVDILVKKERENLLHDICMDFLDLVNEKRGIVIAHIKTAIDISDKDRKALSEKIAKYSGKNVQADFTVDKSIKGGFIAQIDDKIIDASIIRQLQLLREQFAKGNFTNN